MSLRSFAIVCVVATTFLSSFAFSTVSPIGKWTTYDLDNTERTIIEIYQEGDTLSGRVAREINPKKGEKLEPLCSQCQGEQKDKPKLGMVIMWGLEKKGDKWVNGTILDTDSGKTYRCQIKGVSSDGRSLEFRAYVGVPLFGKTITWTRPKEG